MNRILECLTQEHELWLLLVAALVCVTGSCLSVLVSRRLSVASSTRKQVQLPLSGLLAGATIWSTHFIAMLAYDPAVDHGYDPAWTGISLAIAVVGMFGANMIFSNGRSLARTLLAGATLGLTVSVMHYVGMKAYLIPGRINWDTGLLVTSVLFGIGFGAAAYHRIAYPVTRYCWLGGAVLMTIAICSMHFTGMSAIMIELSPLIIVPPQIIAEATLGMLIFSVTAVILSVGFAAVRLETDLEGEALLSLAHSTKHDHLTGLPNRLWLSEWLAERAAGPSEGADTLTAALTLDLDNFKEINDLYGNEAGDHVLQDIARRLAGACQPAEHITRTGGDEFTAVQTGIKDVHEADAFAQRLSTAMEPPVDYNGIAIRFSVSIGVASGVTGSEDINDLVQKSDLAMHRAKASQGTQICSYDADLDEQSRQKRLLVQDLRQALANDEFELVYQLQNELGSLQPTGCEVLLRWRHPERGLISPGQFIPVAEETGLICELGLWVLRTACMEAATWTRPFSIAVNVAPQQLVEPAFLENLADALTESLLDPGRLELEITEASIIADQATTLEVMRGIKAMGVRIAMDDFGTGYSSLATLQSFPFDKIKIDRSFIQDVHIDHQRAAIVRATLLLGDSLGIPVLAEGVEHKDELQFLQDAGCNAVQGFYFGKPMSLVSLRALVCETALEAAS